MIDLDYDGDTVKIEGQEIRVRSPVKEAVADTDKAYLLLSVAADEDNNTNVIALSESGTKMWEIEPPAKGMRNVPYNGIQMREGSLIVYNLNSYKFVVDTDTGDILSVERYDK